MAEMRGFIFAVSVIVIFSGLLITIPTDFLGEGATPDTAISPISPNLISDFTESESYTYSNFTLGVHSYNLGDWEWLVGYSAQNFVLGVKEKFLTLWFGGVSYCKFISDSGTDRGNVLSLTEIADDAEEGEIRYNLIFEDTGNSGGALVFYWNTTLYSDPADAWTNDVLYLLHGLGIDELDGSIGSLLINLLFFQLPDMPFLVNLILVTPLWAMIGYIIWFLIISMIPFLGGA